MIKMLDVPTKVMKPVEAFWGNRVQIHKNSEGLYDLTFPDAGLTYFGEDINRDTLVLFNKEIGTYSTFNICDFSEVKII